MTDLWTSLKQSNKPIFIYGMGNGADKLLDILSAYGIEPKGVFASNGFVRDKSFHGFKLQSYDEIRAQASDFTVLTAFGTNKSDVMAAIRHIASECELYAPDIPVYGDTVFNAEFFNEHKDDLRFVRSVLCDDRSRFVFDSIVSYKLTGDINRLFECQTEKSEAFETVLKLGKHEIFADLGAYRADTVKEFLSHTGGCEKIYAVEPDRKTFAKLTRELADTDNAVCICAAVGAESKKVTFQTDTGRGAHVSGKGEEVDMLTLDEILNGSPVTYIKMDVEGAEADALRGAEKTILKYKPKLRIAAYHRTEDIYDIVNRVFKIRDDYRVYMRHHPYIPAWDTDFYFV